MRKFFQHSEATMAEDPSKSAATKPAKGLLADIAQKFEQARSRRAGAILVRIVGEDGGDFYLHSTSSGCQLSQESRGAPPLVEVIGTADRIRPILDGSKDGRLQFYLGGIRVRGDLQYLSEIAHELGFIKERF
jgi:hypothetical protein